MTTRIDKFRAYPNHPWFNRVYKRLKAPDIKMAEEFIIAHEHLGKLEFDVAANRMFLDKEKPKNWLLIQELVANSNV